MIALLLPFLGGIFSSLLPEVLKFFNKRQENAQELALFQLRLQAEAAEHTYKMEEINAQADVAEAAQLHQPQQSFGVQLLDAAKEHQLGQWALVPAFYLFTLLDFLNGFVRPAVTLAMVGFYMSYKASLYYTMQHVSDASFDWFEGIRNLWGDNDMSILLLVLGFYFGQRGAKYAFGTRGASK